MHHIHVHVGRLHVHRLKVNLFFLKLHLPGASRQSVMLDGWDCYFFEVDDQQKLVCRGQAGPAIHAHLSMHACTWSNYGNVRRN